VNAQHDGRVEDQGVVDERRLSRSKRALVILSRVAETGRTRFDADLDRSLIVTCAKGKNRPA
jgi:hypothetical protein